MKIIGWNVDTQYDFMRPDGKLYVQGAEQIEPKLSALTYALRTKGNIIINTADWHNSESAEISKTPDFITTFPEHCIQDTAGAEYVRATRPRNQMEIDWKGLDGWLHNDKRDGILFNQAVEGYLKDGGKEFVLYKDKFDVFAGTKAAEPLLKILRPDCAVVYGVATNVCVDFAVKGLLKRNVKVYVPTDAIKELPNLPLHYEAWQAKGAVLTTTEEILRELARNKR